MIRVARLETVSLVVKTPNAQSVTAIPALGPKGVAEVSRKRMMGLMKAVAPQLKMLSVCTRTSVSTCRYDMEMPA